MGLPSSRARSSASRPHGYHCTGLCACWRRYALDSVASWFIGAERNSSRLQRQYNGTHSRPMSVDAETTAAPAAAAGELPPLRLKRGEDRRLRAGHLWVFSNEVDTEATPLTALAVGAMVRVLSDREQFLGYAYVNPHALICARIMSRSAVQ